MRSKLVCLLVIILCVFSLAGCVAKSAGRPAGLSSKLELDSWNNDVKKAVNDFLLLYGNVSDTFDKDAYIVSDFDKTVSTFCVRDEVLYYMLENMSFVMRPVVFADIIPKNAGDGFDDIFLDIVSDYGYLFDTYGPFDASGLKESSDYVIKDDPYWQDFASKMLYVYQNTDNEYWCYNWFAGMMDSSVYNIAYEACFKYKDFESDMLTFSGPDNFECVSGTYQASVILGVDVTDNIYELFNAITENGIDIWIVSNDEVNIVKAALDVFELREYVSGIVANNLNKDDYGRKTVGIDIEKGVGYVAAENDEWMSDEYPLVSVCEGEGAVHAIKDAISPHYNDKYPIGAIMDGSDDFNYCTEFESLRLVVCINRASAGATDGSGVIAELSVYEKDSLKYNFEEARKAGDTLYVLQGINENDSAAFVNDSSTTVFGESEHRLFLNDENWKELWYMNGNNMKPAEVINTFAIRTEKGSEFNTLGFAYGFLDEFNGYHSVK